MFGISSNRHQEFSEDDLNKVRKPLIDVDYESDCETAPLSWSSLEVSSPITTSTPSKSPSKKKDKHKSKGSNDDAEPEPGFIVSFSPLESSSSSKRSSKSKKKKEKKSRKSDEKAKSSSKSSKKSSPKPSKKTMGPSPNDRWWDLKVPEQRTRSKSSKTELKRRAKSMGYVKSKEVMNRSVSTSKSSKKSMKPNDEASTANDRWWDLKDPKRRTSRSKSSKTESNRRNKSLPIEDIKSKDAINKSLAKKKKNRKKSKSSKTKQDPKPKFDASKIFKMNVRKLQTAMALTKIFGLESDELVKREMASDSKYRIRRSESLTSICIRKDIVFDWDMPLEHEPPSKQEFEALALKSCLQKKKASSPRSVHWPSNIVDKCQVTNVAGYDESMRGDCFYNSSEIESFRLEVFFENNRDEFEVVDDDDEEYEFIEIIEEEIILEDEEEYEYEYYEEEIVEEWYEEEVIEDTPDAQSISSRRISF